MTDFLQRVENSVRNRKLILPGEKVLVAVSGGVDSMVLLHALKILSEKFSWKITVAHFNHHLRSRASDADEALVRRTAADLKLPLIVGNADVKLFSKKSKLSVEMAARKLRHEFLARAAGGRKIKTVAMAHHADDQVELFFLRLLRGAGIEGLAGMKWKSPSPASRNILLIRPLLDFSKIQLETFARENKIHFREDATNCSCDFLRNRLRNELLPLLRRNYQSSLDKNILRVMEILGAEAEFVGTAIKNFRGDIEKLPLALQRRVLQRQLIEAGIASTFDLVESLRQWPEKFVSAGANISVARKNGGIILRKESSSEFRSGELSVELSRKSGRIVFAGKKILWKRKTATKSIFRLAIGHRPSVVREEFFDANKIGGRILLRHWRPGDRFQPIGVKAPAKLQDLFVNKKISRERRRNLILAEAESGEIFWVDGLRIAENFKIGPQTKWLLVWRLQNN